MKIRIAGRLNYWFDFAHYGQETRIAISTCGIQGGDVPRLRPALHITEGTSVAAGDLLITDRIRPEIRIVAPVGGIVRQIVRGARRGVDRLVLAMEDDAKRRFNIPDPLDRPSLVALMIEAGIWPSLRTRPFENVPRSDQKPDALFITAIDTRPLAPDPAAVIAPRREWFDRGASALRHLSTGRTYLCHAAGASLPTPEGVTAAAFSGAHPAGLVGTHIHYLHPVGARGQVWHIGYQDVIALGHLLAKGTIWTRRIVGVAGDGINQPMLVETVPGADIHELTRSVLPAAAVRLMSGSPIDGRIGRYLARGDVQVSVLRHAPVPERRGLTTRAADWLMRGNYAIVPNALHERAAPPGVLAIPFLRAISVGDVETARRLGALELAEDDLALLGHVDCRGGDYGRMLRQVLDHLEAER
ncbi:Na+-transporting NADH:ubiquinone oxidoreductase subunit A [Devosia enhydra]|uniref:Na(+)-translocating NADH-quinone reductase subunit A n=1 Tax=Devosia enhydra TaxID=665118 RepID=A0A1K2HXU4_9HYPH|nr:hypothetical protein [Devosia enhydra]SFZ84530.1 Na+-transporting NADH:ubiquinone oxidoreductase subunit A [Devosia enhydra]